MTTKGDVDIEQLLIVVELLYKELKGIKRRQYYRDRYAERKNDIRDKVDKQRFTIYGKIGRKWTGKKPIELSFE